MEPASILGPTLKSTDPVETVPGRTSLDSRVLALSQRWAEYRERGSFEHFVEFALALNSLTEQFTRLKLPGLIRLCVALENTALNLFGDATTHPVGPQEAAKISRQLDALVGAVESSHPRMGHEARRPDPTMPV